PKCASPASEGQRYCRQCGTNLGVIVDAMESRRGPADFERVKADLKDLGTSLRSGLEQVHQEFKKKQHEHRKRYQDEHPNWISDITQTASTAANDVKTALFTTPAKAPDKPKRSRESRRYHLQKGILSIFTGSASAAAYYWLLKTAAASGLLANLEQLVLQRNPNLTGLVPVVEILWVFCLIPVATGIGHLINGALFAPSEKELKDSEMASNLQTEMPANAGRQPNPFSTTTTRATNEIAQDFGTDYSVTEEPTLPLDQPRRERQAS
ncbi:MAG: hypothetical protein JNM09_29410, partial [Blastocatellia bacterium]|nr:hypothetical protein [Blastocatellia bacterium]